MSAQTEPRRLVGAMAALGVGLVVWSLRSVLSDPLHTLWGQSIDAVHSAWVLWWVHQDPAQAWVDFPVGTRGAVMPPLTVHTFRWVSRLSTPVLAHTAMCLGSLLFDMAALGLLAARVSQSRPAGALAALLFLAARPALAQVALGNPEGVAVGWLCLAVWAGLVWAVPQGDGAAVPDPGLAARHPWLWSGGVGMWFALSVIENPYTLVPGGTAALGLGLVRLRRRGGVRAGGLAAWVGAALVGGRLLLVGGEPGGTLLPNARLAWRGLEWQMYDILAPTVPHLVSPWPRPDLTAPAAEIGAADAHHFLGWTLLALAGLSVSRRSLPWLLGSVAALAFSLGSAPLGNPGPPGPFLLLNQLLAAVIAPVTQPERFLVFAVLGLSVAAAVGASRLAGGLRRVPRGPVGLWLGLAGLTALEAVTLGGPAIEVPTLSTRPLACFADLPAGPVFTLEDPGRAGEPASAGMLLQMVHGQPGTHHGVGGWSSPGPEATMVRLREDMLRTLTQGRTSRPLGHMLRDLRCEGVRWLVLPEARTWARAPTPAVACGGWVALELTPDLGGPCREKSGGGPEPAPIHGKLGQ